MKLKLFSNRLTNGSIIHLRIIYCPHRFLQFTFAPFLVIAKFNFSSVSSCANSDFIDKRNIDSLNANFLNAVSLHYNSGRIMKTSNIYCMEFDVLTSLWLHHSQLLWSCVKCSLYVCVSLALKACRQYKFFLRRFDLFVKYHASAENDEPKQQLLWWIYLNLWAAARQTVSCCRHWDTTRMSV